jgi:N-acetylglucosamine kinase-like BadF-type ATPase
VTAPLPAVLAIDGGNSKSDLALVAADGALLGSARGPGMANAASLDVTLPLLAALIGRAQQQAGLAGLPVARHLCACVANADLPQEQEQLAAALLAQGWSQTTTVVNDTFAVLRAGLTACPDPPGQPRWGVGVVCGAGINCVGVAPDGRTTGFLALGGITGDWGGGNGLGRAALWWAMRAEDGRGPQTALAGAVAAHFGTGSVQEVAVGLHLGTIDEASLRELAPLVLALGSEGDEVAAALVGRQADEICAMVLTVMRRLDLVRLATPVVLGGGMLAARDPLLTARTIDSITATAPRAAVRITDVPPVAGAALMGLDYLGAGPEAERRLRAAYAEGPGYETHTAARTRRNGDRHLGRPAAGGLHQSHLGTGAHRPADGSAGGRA